MVANWAKETFSFISSEDTNDHVSNASSAEGFTSLQDALTKSNRDPDIAPTWIPDRFILEKIEKDVSPIREVFRAFYLCGDKELIIQIQSYLDCTPENIEINEELIEIYKVGKQDYYFFSNYNMVQAIWVIDSYECYILGDLSIDELKSMIDSIEKG